jgi:cell division protein FtsW
VIDAQADQSQHFDRKALFSFDPWMAIIAAVMIIFGLVMVYSASWDVSWRLHGDPNALFNRQIGNLLIGLIAMLAAFFFPLGWLRRVALPLIAFTILILFAVLVVNLGGEYRRAFLGASVQPSELAKLALVIYLAVWMESKGERLSTLGYGFAPLIVIVGIVGGLIVAQPDLSAGLTIGLVAITMFFLAGASSLQTLGLAAGGSLVGYIVIRLHQTGAQRWLQFRDGLVDIEKPTTTFSNPYRRFIPAGF